MSHDLLDRDDDHRPARPASERGSAMIIALMIMIILTLLGVTFLVLAEQEQQIAVNERDLTQALYIAEAGVEVAKTWFNKPAPADNPFKPAVADMTFDLRAGRTFEVPDYSNEDERTAPGDNLDGVQYSGGDGLPFEKEYRGDVELQFHGRRDSPDVLVCQTGEEVDLDGDGTDDCSSGATGFMADLNDTLLSMPSGEHSGRDLGEVMVQQIRVYRPPLDYDLDSRYGIATIEAIAVKKVRGGRIVTQRAVRDVIQEIPFPGPGGAIETEAEVGQGGSAGVHWGPVVSAALNDPNDNINLPNSNAANFPQASIPRTTPSRWGFHHTINPASGDNLSPVPAASDGPTPDQAFTALTELLGITRNGEGPSISKKGVPTYEDPVGAGDPWLIFRARNNILAGGTPIGPGSQPHPYIDLRDTVDNGDRFDNNSDTTWNHMFQRQIVRFPPVQYETWKEVVRSGQEGMFYFSYVAGSDPPEWRLNGSGDGQEFSYWVNRVRPGTLGAGVFFFDTVDSIAPHDDDDDGVADNLTPGTQFEKVGANDAYMEGFALAYAGFLSSTGVGTGVPVDVNMPGEVFLDDGIDLHDGTGPGDDCICIRVDESGCVLGLAPIQWGSGNEECGPAAIDCRCTQGVLDLIDLSVGRREAATFRNGEWDADLDNDGQKDTSPGPGSPGWNTFIGAPSTDGLVGHAFADHRLPHYPTGTPRNLEAGKFAQDRWRDPRFLNNTLGGFSPSQRQPHEPFLNFDYPTDGSTIAGWGNVAANAVSVDFDNSGEAKGCDYDANGRRCDTITEFTSVARDKRGALMTLNLNVNGVLYCDGYYTGTGNMKVYGSMMMRGGYDGSASLDVWFNEELADGLFPPPEWELPRIYTSARDTD